jgi:pyruvate formate lyase activating enzyme
MSKISDKMSKREFVRRTMMSLGGIYCINSVTKLFARNFAEDKSGDASSAPWKWSKVSPYFITIPRGVKCQLCPHECTIKEGDFGQCQVRTNYQGKLYTTVYGNPCAVHIDPIEKKPLFHFLPGSKAFSIATAGCNLSCLNCQNWSISQSSPKETKNEDLMPEKVVQKALDNHCEVIAYTYTEPTVFFEYVFDTSVLARRKGLKNIIKSNGYIKEKPLRDLCPYLDAANIDLKAFDNDTYLKLTGGELDPVLNSLKILKQEHVWLEITYLVVPGWTDKETQFKAMCEWLVKNGMSENPLHIDRFNPEYKLTQLPPTPVSTLEKLRNIALVSGLKFAYIGNLPGANYEDTLCPHCKKNIVMRKGFQVVKNDLIKGSCKYCHTKVPGIWN